MEVRPILSALLRNKTGAVLISMQVALTLAIVCNAIFIISVRTQNMDRPSGLDEANTLMAGSVLFDDSQDYLQVVQDDLDAIRQLPGVVAVTPMSSVPLSGGGWGEDLFDKADPDATRFITAVYMTDENGLDALNLKLVEGRYFRADEIVPRPPSMVEMPGVAVISKTLADELFPDGSAVGQVVYDEIDSGPVTVIGVYERLQAAWQSWQWVERSTIIPSISADGRNRYVVRVAPGKSDELIPELETLLAANDGRLVTGIQPFVEMKERAYSRDAAMVKLLSGVIVLLIVITGLGIVGLAWFSVTQRRKQIGTRRALGAQKFHILRYFLVENWLITSLGVVLGLGLAVLLNYWLDQSFETGQINWYYLPIGAALLWLLGLISVLAPARRAARVAPAVATRTV